MSVELTTLDTTVRAAAPSAMRRRVLRRILRNPLAVTGLAVVGVAAIVALLAGVLVPYPFDQVNFRAPLQPPTGAHWFGTDSIGRDQLSRVIFGLRASVSVGLLSVLLSLSIGVPTGLLAGFYGFLDPFVSRFTDTLLAFPFLVLAVGLAAILGPSLSTAIMAIGIAQIPAVVRVTRSETLRLREMDFVAAAVADGASDWVLLRHHILPNATNALIVQATVAIPGAIIGEAVLSFLGLGVRPPTPSLGIMLADAQTFVRDAPWMAVFPGVTIVVIALALNLLGDGLRDALDPRENRS